ncbi:MAG: hypothetical protein E7549_04775 [Ruminococcaceae bacterium]|nr:hypothetical protein [Oscillospiraceae bacterium]
MKRIKLLSLLLVLVMLLSLLAGCGEKEVVLDTPTEEDGTSAVTTTTTTTRVTEEDEETYTTTKAEPSDVPAEGYITSKETFIQRMDEMLDLSLYNELYESTSEFFDSYSYSIQYDHKQEYDLDYTCQLDDGSEIAMPMTFDELAKEGWTLSNEAQGEQEISANCIAFPHIKNKDNNDIGISVYNSTKEAITLKECVLMQMRLTQYSTYDPSEREEGAIGFTVCGNLTEASTTKEIIKRLGNPSNVYCSISKSDEGEYRNTRLTLTYRQPDIRGSIEFQLSGDGDYILQVTYEAEY